MDLSIIIVNYNTADLLEPCLNSIFESDMNGIQHEVIVVENASKDKSGAMVKNKFPRVRLIENNENLYFNKANNQGIVLSKGHVVFILNPDTVIEKSALRIMYFFLVNHKHIGAVTCKMIFPNKVVQYNCSKFPQYKNLIFSYTFIGRIFKSLRDKIMNNYFYGEWDRLTHKYVEVIPGSAMMIKREVLEQVGFFDEKFMLYFSDDDLCERIRRNNYKIMYIPDSKIVHYEKQSVKRENREIISRIYLKDMIIFSLKYYGIFHSIVLKILVELTEFFRQVKRRV